ncbi:EpsG family protein [Vibrio splendidus]|uniref:EpsG family protein n=1 Tax=Vibrio splendidus TaxID=29497 RepID=UPI001054FA9E|nr:EpsG family protein [Vibrio splendidus]
MFSVLTISLLFYHHITGIKAIKYMLFLLVVGFCGLRYYVGTDFPAYVEYFKSIDAGLVKFQGKEIGYTYLNYVVKYWLGLNFQSVFLLSSLLTFAFLSSALTQTRSVYIYTFGFFLYVFSGFYTQSFNIVRQSLSMAICLYALKYINYREVYKYYSFLLFALLFHTTAIVFFPLYFIYNLKLNRKVLMLSLVAAFLFGNVVLQIITFLLEFFQMRYVEFLSPGEDDLTSGSGLMQYITYFLCLFSIFHLDKIEKNYLIYFKVFYLYVFFNLVFFDFMLGIRAVQGYKLSMIIFIPYMFTLFKGHSRYLIILLCAIYYFGFLKFIMGSSNIIPYDYSFYL